MLNSAYGVSPPIEEYACLKFRGGTIGGNAIGKIGGCDAPSSGGHTRRIRTGRSDEVVEVILGETDSLLLTCEGAADNPGIPLFHIEVPHLVVVDAFDGGEPSTRPPLVADALGGNASVAVVDVFVDIPVGSLSEAEGVEFCGRLVGVVVAETFGHCLYPLV